MVSVVMCIKHEDVTPHFIQTDFQPFADWTRGLTEQYNPLRQNRYKQTAHINPQRIPKIRTSKT